MAVLKLFIRKIWFSQRGQALPVVLALLVIGGLTVVPSINFATTAVNHGIVVDNNTNGIYAAEAGVENVIWCLSHNSTSPLQLNEPINNMQVTMQTVNKGTYTIYFGELVQTEGHYYDLSVAGSAVWDTGANAYKYTITVTRMGRSTVIHLTEVGVRLPLNYTYQAGSANSFPSNLSREEPETVYDSFGSPMLKWEFNTPLPSVTESNPTKTQVFYFTGSGNLADDYTWVVANRMDIGEVGELTGTLYVITSTATDLRNGQAIARINASTLLIGTTPHIITWQVTN